MQNHLLVLHSHLLPIAFHCWVVPHSLVHPVVEGHWCFHLLAEWLMPLSHLGFHPAGLWSERKEDVAWIRNAQKPGMQGAVVEWGDSVHVNWATAQPGAGIWGRQGTSHERCCWQGTFRSVKRGGGTQDRAHGEERGRGAGRLGHLQRVLRAPGGPGGTTGSRNLPRRESCSL